MPPSGIITVMFRIMIEIGQWIFKLKPPSVPRRSAPTTVTPKIGTLKPPWVNKRLFEVEFWNDTTSTIHDPAAGIGQVVRAAREHGLKATGADLVDRNGGAFPVQDFLTCSIEKHDSVVTNPPYGLLREFTERALRLARNKVCILCPVARLNAARWLEASGLFCIWLLTPRPSMPPGEVFLGGGKASGGKADFCWLVFQQGYRGEPFVNWLHRDGPVIDYMN